MPQQTILNKNIINFPLKLYFAHNNEVIEAQRSSWNSWYNKCHKVSNATPVSKSIFRTVSGLHSQKLKSSKKNFFFAQPNSENYQSKKEPV